MRPMASPRNHEKAQKAGDRIEFCPHQKKPGTDLNLSPPKDGIFRRRIALKALKLRRE
ncbi:MAG: hypothetical protein ETSY1_15430 [Candidatus Entotheonella factor]|uniref:Uncharacterized protein n=1 Tax=Entotheonella factor TaxID=1429438 RepID=W4LPJ0_ENTF1|nr:MAG: hypothetical protein ETSY1_15430 [Candidatus Entotheonella factor]